MRGARVAWGVPMERVLIVDDDRELCELVAELLGEEGFEVEVATRSERGLERALSGEHALLVLDVMMPGMNGFEVLRRLRAQGSGIHVMMLTARGDDVDRIVGLEIGADDYLPKPFALEELLARLRALLRRRSADDVAARAGAPRLEFADLSLDPDTREVRRGERPISLTRTEFALLELLIAHPRRVLSRGQILEQVWGYDFPTTGNALEVYIGYLRRKTEADGEPRLIHTVRGVGYVLRESPP